LRQLPFVKLLPLDHGLYSGLFSRHGRSGFGVFVQSDGSKYEGMWQKDKREGKGRQIYASGFLYEGEWKAGFYHGWGEFFKDGYIY